MKYMLWLPVLAGLSACQTINSSEAWNNAQIDNSQKAYQAFLEQFPKSYYADIARTRLQRMVWHQARRQNSYQAYAEFVKQYPDSVHVRLAKRMMEDIVWTDTQESHTERSYREFAERFPHSPRLALVKKQIMQIRWRQTQQDNGVEDYQRFLQQFPDSEYNAAARTRLDDVSWQQANSLATAQAYEHYLSLNPQGTRRAQAIARSHCTDQATRKRFPHWLARHRGTPPLSVYETQVSTDYQGYHLEVDPVAGNTMVIALPVGRRLVYVSGKGVITGIKGDKVMVGYNCINVR